MPRRPCPTRHADNQARNAALAAARAGLGAALCALAIPAAGRAAEPPIDLSYLHLTAVFGTDRREPLPPRLLPLKEKLGVLFNIRQKSVCSAFCVDAATIGTAAHCLFKTAGEKPPKLSDFWFARNYDTMRDYARIAGHDRGAAAQNIIAGGFTLSTVPPIDASKDWAFIRLSRPVCAKGGLEIDPATPEKVLAEAKAGRIFQISYHKDFKQWQPAHSKPCKVERAFGAVTWPMIAADFSAPDNLLLHMCDTGGASSGSPLLMETPTGPKVVGINVGTYVQSKVSVPLQTSAAKSGGEAIANTGVAAAAFADQVKALRAAHILGGAVPIRELQERLTTAGHYKGPIDGTYGPALKTSIDAFEAASKLPQTGIASEDLLSRLRLMQASGAAAAKR